MRYTFLFITFLVAHTLYAKRIVGPQGYQFSHTIFLDNSPVKNQERTGTCWSYSTTSFIESELLRMHGTEVDIAEMYFVRKNYEEKAFNYVLRQGKAQFSQGGLNHDVMNALMKYGMVPQSAYPGNEYDTVHNHSEMEAIILGIIDAAVSNPNGQLSPVWKQSVNATLDGYLGADPAAFEYDGKNYTPQTFAEKMRINPYDYVTFTSFNFQPYYRNYVLQVPDNWSNGNFMNVPMNELMLIIDEALNAGYTIAWDADVSEPTFSRKKGIAILPRIPFVNMTETQQTNLFREIQPEVKPSEALRAEWFLNYTTTDDHLMHIVGKAIDQQKNTYYIVKNSWGDHRANKGYVYVSESYMALKTLGIMLHKDGVPALIQDKLSE